MNVIYRDRTKQGENGNALLQQATERLQEILGDSQKVVKAEWDRSEDEHGQPLYTLKIEDFSGAAQARFTPEEFANANHMFIRLNGLWGKLLQVRSHKLRDQLREAGGLED